MRHMSGSSSVRLVSEKTKLQNRTTDQRTTTKTADLAQSSSLRAKFAECHEQPIWNRQSMCVRMADADLTQKASHILRYAIK